MSSGTISNPNAARNMTAGLADGLSTSPPGLNPRQMYLDHLWGFYSCTTYDHCKVDWAGREVTGLEQSATIAQAGYLPPGFVDAGQDLPLKFRRPTAPYHLGRTVVDRFTGLLFSNRRSPKFIVEGDPATEDFINGIVEVTRFWSTFAQARTFGGAMGAVAVGFTFENGTPMLEVHDPRWCLPEFTNRNSNTLKVFEKRYAYPDMVQNSKGEWVEAWFWYRRVIDSKSDTVWPRVPVSDQEPDWAQYTNTVEEHLFGFVPVVWIQNLPTTDTVDGDSDCRGAYDAIQAIDGLLAQAHKGTIANCDPTLLLSSDAEFDQLKKGSDNAIQLEKGGVAQYLEIQGSGPKAAMDLAEKLEEKTLRMVRCYLDTNKTGGAKSIVEVERDYSSMLEKADLLREQYGERGAKTLMEMIIRAVRVMTEPALITKSTGERVLVKRVVALPPKILSEADTGQAVFTERQLGPSSYIKLQWPEYFHPTLDDAEKAVRAAALAKEATLIDAETAVQFIAQFFNITDIPALVQKLKAAEKEKAAQTEAGMLNRLLGGFGGGGGPPGGTPGT